MLKDDIEHAKTLRSDCIYLRAMAYMLGSTENGDVFLREVQQPYIVDKQNFDALVTELQKFYAKHGDDEIYAYNQDVWYAAKRECKELRERRIETKRTEVAGYVYILEAPNNVYKIGMTTRTPDERVAELVPKLPFIVEIMATIKTDDALGTETYLHHKYADKRLNNGSEWFALTNKDRQAILKMANESWRNQ